MCNFACVFIYEHVLTWDGGFYIKFILFYYINCSAVYVVKGISTTEGPVHTKTIVNANASERKHFYALRPSVHAKTMKTLTINT